MLELFPDGNYEFHLTLRRAEPPDFFRPRDVSGDVLAERARWLAADAARYVRLTPGAESLLAEFCGLLAAWGLHVIDPKAPACEQLLELGRSLEPDLLFLSQDAQGEFRLAAGALCFPTGWALEEKLGHTLEEIHGVVPGLNAALGASIQQFLSRLRPGIAYLRHNWGIAATDELNLHPARGVAALQPPVELKKLWLRIEYQALLALPESRGIVFGIRIANHRLDEVAAGPARPGLRRALQTMPSELAAYKRIDGISRELIRQL